MIGSGAVPRAIGPGLHHTSIASGRVRVAIVAGCLLLAVVLEAALLAAPERYAVYALVPVAAPLALLVLLRLPVGSVLAVGLIGGTLVNFFLAPGNADGIPPQAVLVVAFAEFALFVRLVREGGGFTLRGVELLYLAAVGFSLVLGLLSGGLPRVWLAEAIETVNLVVLILILRGLRFGVRDAVTFAVTAQLLLLPFLLQYLATEFGVRRIDFYFSQVGALIPLSVWALVAGGSRWRLPLFMGLLVLVVAAVSTGQRGMTVVAMVGAAAAIGIHTLSAASPGRLLVLLLLGGVVGAASLEALPILQQVLPGSTERLAEGFGAVSFDRRVTEAQDALGHWRSQPWGHGFGAALNIRSDITYEVLGPRLIAQETTFIHNSYAWYLAKMGIQGLVALLLLIGGSALVALRGVFAGHAPAAMTAALTILVISAGGALGGPALHGFYYTPWVAMAVVLATSWLYAEAPAAVGEDVAGGDAAFGASAEASPRPVAPAAAPPRRG